MKNKQITIALLWLVTVVAAYFLGGSGDSSSATKQNTQSGGQPGAGASSASGSAADQRAVVRKLRPDELESGGGEKLDIRGMIGRVRVEMGAGMGGMTNMRGMIRAISPLLELDDAQVQEALMEVEKNVTEPQQKMMFYSLLLSQWAEKDGKAALDYATTHLKSNPMFDFGVKAAVLGSWARTNPDGAWRWFETEGKAAAGDRGAMAVVGTLFGALASRDVDTALNRVAGLDESQRHMAISGIANSAGSPDARQRLLDRASSLPAATRDQLRQGVANGWAMADPEGALKWLRTLPAEEQAPIRQSIGPSMLMMNPARGAEVMLENAKEEEKPRLYDQVVGQWAQSDVRAAGEWMQKQTQGPELDNARMTYARVVAQKEPAAAMDWSISITKPESREASIRQIYGMWRVRDAAAADASLDASGLDPAVIQNIRERQPAVREEGTAPFKTLNIR